MMAPPHRRQAPPHPPPTHDGSSLLGLGFGTSNHNAAAGSAEDLMQHYLQQCLEYHDEQDQQEVGATVPQFVAPIKQDKWVPNDGLSLDDPPRVINPQQQQQQQPPMSLLPDAIARARAVVQTFAPPSAPIVADSRAVIPTNDTILLSHTAQEAIAKARAIVQTFQQQPQAAQATASSSLPCDYKNRRDYYLDTVEHNKLRKALIKNFDYIANKEEERLQRQLKQVEATKQYEVELERKQHEVQKQRQQQNSNMRSTTSGIGAQQHRIRSRSIKKRKRDNNENETSLYLSNLPSTIEEDQIRQLFSSYGAICRIQLYRHKQTGELKGDGLVVFGAEGNEPMEFLTGICQQMNGCELPCGNVLHVEPSTSHASSSNYGPAAAVTPNPYGPPSKETVATPGVQESIDPAVEEEENLDDFFASLE